jgi:hypothetical protein
VNWFSDGFELQTFLHPSGERIWAHNFNLDYIFKEFLSWTDITTKGFSVRRYPKGYLFDATGLSAFKRIDSTISFEYIASLCNSKVGFYIAQILNPTMHFKSGDFAEIPLIYIHDDKIEKRAHRAIEFSNKDWHSNETSWGFRTHQLLNKEYDNNTLRESYVLLRTHWNETISELKILEEENNRIFIEAYGLQDDLTTDIPLKEITLTCNPHYRYGGRKSEAELEALLLADTMKEFISYAVGCMFGRYSLDKPGLILANQGEKAEDYRRQIPNPAFPPDEDNVLPILEAGWFNDDITERFKKFLRVTFGDENYGENLTFLENAIGRDIRSYFLKDFYNEHIQMYKNRPIYWLFSSSNGSFNALVYMHRYRPDTVSVVLNDYLREFVRKLNAHKAHLEQVSLRMGGSQAEKTKAVKEINALNKVLAELKEYEDEVLYPLATRQLQIDLDDGVRVNYAKFGEALAKIPGL